MNHPTHFHNRKDRLKNELSIQQENVTDPSLLRRERPEEAKNVAPARDTGKDARRNGISWSSGRPRRANEVVGHTSERH